MAPVYLLIVLGCTPQVAATQMVEIPAGSFIMGRDGTGHLEEGPAHKVTISRFYLDETLVTVAQFRAYVAETGVRTSAERAGHAKTSVEGMDDWAWARTPGAHWRQPWGPDATVATQRDDEPVVQISWNDANAYCEHYGKRLPTEAEWAYAMGAGARGTRYAWGDSPTDAHGNYRLNYWQGRDHKKNALSDGYLYLSPVKAFPPNAWGIYDSVGNAWQWTSDWFSTETFTHDAAGVTDPKGASEGWAKVARGGSWWCSDTSCSAYGLYGRGKSRTDAAFPNNSFRCAQSPDDEVRARPAPSP